MLQATRSPSVMPSSRRAPALDLQHRGHRLRDRDRRLGHRHRVGGDAGDGAVRTDEDHVERDQGVAHPEAGRARRIEREEHARVRRQAAAVHQPLRLLLGRARDLHREAMRARAAVDGELDEVEARRRRGAAAQAASLDAGGAAAGREQRQHGAAGGKPAAFGQAGSTSTASGPLRPLAMRARSG